MSRSLLSRNFVRRELTAALMLGADGVLIGTRLRASVEANVGPRMHAAANAATGDETVRSQVMDIARSPDWPAHYGDRVLRNQFTDRWHGHETELIQITDRRPRSTASELRAEGRHLKLCSLLIGGGSPPNCDRRHSRQRHEAFGVTRSIKNNGRRVY